MVMLVKDFSLLVSVLNALVFPNCCFLNFKHQYLRNCKGFLVENFRVSFICGELKLEIGFYNLN